MAVFNNLVFFDPKEKVNSPDHIVPDLAESWSVQRRQDPAHLQAAPGREVA
jgi:ABC-type transport system substrate-binding protein